MKLKLTIEQIWRGCQKGERKAQAELYQHFSSKMFSVCLRYAADRAEAEDILQNGFIKVFRKNDLFDGKGSLEGWIRRIMVNTAIEYYRKRKVKFTELDQENDSSNQLVSGFVADQTGYKDLLLLVNSLPVNYRTVFNLFAIEGYSHKEISEMLSITEVNSKSQLSRARTWLREQLNKMEEFNERA